MSGRRKRPHRARSELALLRFAFDLIVRPPPSLYGACNIYSLSSYNVVELSRIVSSFRSWIVSLFNALSFTSRQNLTGLLLKY